MNEESAPEAVLVAVDFSTSSIRALDRALSLRRPGSEVVVLHVIDTHLARRIEGSGAGSYAEAVSKMRQRAEDDFAWLRKERGEAQFETMLAEGLPFAEIVKIANDLECDLIVVGKHGTAPELRDFLFGSTAEKVVRGARQPVLCVP